MTSQSHFAVPSQSSINTGEHLPGLNPRRGGVLSAWEGFVLSSVDVCPDPNYSAAQNTSSLGPSLHLFSLPPSLPPCFFTLLPPFFPLFSLLCPFPILLKTKFHYGVQVDLESVFLPQPPKFWDHRCALLHPANNLSFNPATPTH